MKLWTNVKKWLPGALIVALLCGLIGGAYAKYVKQDTREGTVTIKANLGTIELLEHEAEKQDDGSYKLLGVNNGLCDGTDHTHMDGTTSREGNTYKLLPGLDIPKDPFVRITGKTPIEAYVFIEVVTNIDTDNKDMTTDKDVTDDHNVSYFLTNDWQLISTATDETTKVTTAVYVYTTVVNEAFGANGTGTIQILENNTIYVSQKLNVPTDGVYLNFSACMYEVASVEKTDGESTFDHAKKVYTQNNS